MKKLAIIGLGLMGGSLGLAVKGRGLAESVCGYARREENRREALKSGVIDSVSDSPEAAVRDADIVVFCVPVLAVGELAESCKAHFSDNCVVTDVASTKTELVSELTALLEDTSATFVGSHPMAGSAESGLDAARADLYEGAMVVITSQGAAGRQTADACPEPDRERNRPDRAVEMVRGLWEGLGARTVIMGPAEHDRIIARTSHLPHLVAAMLVGTVYRVADDETGEFCGQGFRDTTRIAGGAEEIWHDIVKSNREFVSRELDEFGDILDRVKAMIDEKDFEGVRRFLAESRRLRRGLCEG